MAGLFPGDSRKLVVLKQLTLMKFTLLGLARAVVLGTIAMITTLLVLSA